MTRTTLRRQIERMRLHQPMFCDSSCAADGNISSASAPTRGTAWVTLPRLEREPAIPRSDKHRTRASISPEADALTPYRLARPGWGHGSTAPIDTREQRIDN